MQKIRFPFIISFSRNISEKLLSSEARVLRFYRDSLNCWADQIPTV